MPEKLTPNHFSFRMALSKAFEQAGKKYVEAVVSDTRLDYHEHHMTEKALNSMSKMLKSGAPQPDGKLAPVLLLETHDATFEMGYGVDGWITKAQDGAFELNARFELLDGVPSADLLFSQVQSGTCNKQLSVGGDAMGHSYWDEALKKSVRSLDDVPYLEHVACTRSNRAAVGATGFVQAMLKSLDGIPLVGQPSPLTGGGGGTLEKKALSESERKKSATVVLDNDKSQSMYSGGDGKLYLFPIPDGDTNAAKVALSEMHDYPLSRQQKQDVHDRAKEVLGDEHTGNGGYCPYCDSGSFAYSKGELPLTKDKNADAPKEGAAGDNDMDKTEVEQIVKGLLDAQKADTDQKLSGIEALLKSVAEKSGVDTRVKSSEEVLLETMLKGVALIVDNKLDTFRKEARPRQGGEQIPAGAMALLKNQGGQGKTPSTIEDLLKQIGAGASGNGTGTESDTDQDGDGESQASAAINSISAKLEKTKERMDNFLWMRKNRHQFTPAEDAAARQTAEEHRRLQTQLRAATLGVPTS